jgi:predicted nucleic acid-binding protein
VLTRLPPLHRAAPANVRAFLANEFPEPWLALAGENVAKLLGELVDRGISGGATYDGLIGATAKSAGATLYTCDRRARGIYELLGVEVQFVG